MILPRQLYKLNVERVKVLVCWQPVAVVQRDVVHEASRTHVRCWEAVKEQAGTFFECSLHHCAEKERAGTPEDSVDCLRLVHAQVEKLEGAGFFKRSVHVPKLLVVHQSHHGCLAFRFADI